MLSPIHINSARKESKFSLQEQRLRRFLVVKREVEIDTSQFILDFKFRFYVWILRLVSKCG